MYKKACFDKSAMKFYINGIDYIPTFQKWQNKHTQFSCGIDNVRFLKKETGLKRDANHIVNIFRVFHSFQMDKPNFVYCHNWRRSNQFFTNKRKNIANP